MNIQGKHLNKIFPKAQEPRWLRACALKYLNKKTKWNLWRINLKWASHSKEFITVSFTGKWGGLSWGYSSVYNSWGNWDKKYQQQWSLKPYQGLVNCYAMRLLTNSFIDRTKWQIKQKSKQNSPLRYEPNTSSSWRSARTGRWAKRSLSSSPDRFVWFKKVKNIVRDN